MQIVLLIAVCFVFDTLAEKSLQEENLQTNTHKVNDKKEKFSYLLNLLKSAITEDDKKNTENQNFIKESDIEAIHNQSEIKTQNGPENTKIENEELKIENDAVLDKTLNKILTKISTAIENKPKNDMQMKNIPKTTEMPSMIPIFKPRKAKVTPKSNQILSQFKEKFNNQDVNFNIPCHRSADVLEISTHTLKHEQGNTPPITNVISNNIPCQENSVNPNNILVNVAPVTNSISNIARCKENCVIPKNVQGNVTPITNVLNNIIPSKENTEISRVKGNITPITNAITNNIPCKENPVVSIDSHVVDESVKMLFKPKAISLMQLYGNLLKKITITVLVPYHISKIKS